MEDLIMGRLSVVIVDPEPGQELGSQLMRALHPDECYRLDLREGVRDTGERFGEQAPEVVVAVLPCEVPEAHRLLADLASLDSSPSILPVVHQESLDFGLDALVNGSDEFLVTPLVDAEIRLRVQRLVRRKTQMGPARRLDLEEAWERMQLVGEDVSILELKRKI